jgi:hypothetical protein
MCISVQCSVALELGAECTYPVAEGTSSGLLYMIGQGLAIIMISLMDGPLTVGEDRNMLPAMWFCFALILLATVFAFAFRGKYLRLEHSLAMAAGAGVWPMRFRTTTLSAACPANGLRQAECNACAGSASVDQAVEAAAPPGDALDNSAKTAAS